MKSPHRWITLSRSNLVLKLMGQTKWIIKNMLMTVGTQTTRLTISINKTTTRKFVEILLRVKVWQNTRVATTGPIQRQLPGDIKSRIKTMNKLSKTNGNKTLKTTAPQNGPLLCIMTRQPTRAIERLVITFTSYKLIMATMAWSPSQFLNSSSPEMAK